MPNCHTRANLSRHQFGKVAVWFIAMVIAVAYGIINFNPAKASEENGVTAVLLSLETNGETISLNFDQPVEMQISHLEMPPRLVLDLPQTNFAVLDKGVRLPEIFKAIRFGMMSKGQSRIVLTFDMPAIANAQQPNVAKTNHEIAIVAVEPVEFAARASEDAATLSAIVAPKSDRLGQLENIGGQGPFTLVIDPGHGGIDGGAEGKLGTREKDVTLAFGLAIRDALKDAPNVRVVMTRETDVFVGLHERVKIARQNEAELFLSIHGDSIKLPEIRGATLYTLSDSASDAISSALANQENLSDSIAGLPPMQPDAEMNSILVDLLKQETATFSRELASQIIVHLKENEVELINNPIRAAGFSVLTAPDVPSLLLEMGYLSNNQDELLMRDPKWRERTAQVIAKAVATYAKGHRTRIAN